MVYAIMGGFMALTIIATLLAPDTIRPPASETEERALREPGAIEPKWRGRSVSPWSGSAGPGPCGRWGSFMARVLKYSRLKPVKPAVGQRLRAQHTDPGSSSRR